MSKPRRTAPTTSSPLAKAGKALGGLLSARAGGAAASRGGRGGRRQTQATGLSKLLRSVRR